ncbi:MAG: NADH-quinone oxidoreductase subunit N [Rhodothermales bacterium]|nr:NADH-quinone oxidoreductase subunit N [Rhodothermales bacterium]MBO6780646.1 NADH-quinone oxidoreductase subunit N [Rhodothermales bacterium]
MDLTNAYADLAGDLMATAPITLLAVLGLIAVVVDSFRNDHRSVPWIAGVGLGVALVWELTRLNDPAGTAFYGMLRTGGFASFVNVVILLGAGLSVELCGTYLKRIKHNYGEVYAIILFATVGMMVLGASNNLISVFVGLETMSICLYVLTGLVRDDEGGIESALKYFLLGAFATGFLLYGMALIYGATGTFYLPEIAAAVAINGASMLFWAGTGLLLVGFMFKVSAVPFHMWTPDVYQGAPTTITGFMSTASKTAAFASLILVLFLAFPGDELSYPLAVIALITMVLGNVLAVAQNNVKRMLAYSSVAHAGYVLVGLAAGSQAGYSGALYYMLIYTLMNIGAFGVMALLEWDDKEGREQTLDSLAGVGLRKPLLGWTMVFFMFSLSGFPPLGGFMGKVAVFAPAVEAGMVWLAIAGVLTSAVSAYYYLRVLVVFFMRSEDEVRVPVANNAFPVPRSAAAVLIFCAAALLVLGVYPQLLELTESYFASTAVASLP